MTGSSTDRTPFWPHGLTLDEACESMHDAYEAAAATQGWATQERSRKPWADVPEANKATMRVAVATLIALIGEHIEDTQPPTPPAAADQPHQPHNEGGAP